MTVRSTLSLVSALLTFGLATTTPARATSQFPDVGLRGIKTLCLSVQALDLLPDSAAERQIEAQALARLQHFHLPVVSAEACDDSPGQAWLYLWLKARKSGSGKLYAYEVEIDLRQRVTLTRNPQIKLEPASTWHNWELGLADTDKLVSVLKHSSLNLVDMFAKMYEDENPN